MFPIRSLVLTANRPDETRAILYPLLRQCPQLSKAPRTVTNCDRQGQAIRRQCLSSQENP